MNDNKEIKIGIASPAPQTTDQDAAIAYRIQQAYLQGYSEPVAAQNTRPVPDMGGIPMVSATAIYGTAFIPLRTEDEMVGDSERHVLETFALSRAIIFLSVLDLVFLVIIAIFNPFWLLYIWGPICGYYGATRFDITFTYIFLLYYAFRLVGDLTFFIMGFWWMIVPIVLTIWIVSFIWTYATYLNRLSPTDIYHLRNPSPVWLHENSHMLKDFITSI
eukprot:gene8807-18230_t